MENEREKRKLVTAREMAQLLAMSETWIRLQYYAGRIPGYKLGRSLRFDPIEVIEAVKVKGGTPSIAE